jgi:hypothetical protein
VAHLWPDHNFMQNHNFMHYCISHPAPRSCEEWTKMRCYGCLVPRSKKRLIEHSIHFWGPTKSQSVCLKKPKPIENLSFKTCSQKMASENTAEFEEEEIDGGVSKFRHWPSWQKNISFNNFQQTGSVGSFASHNDRVDKIRDRQWVTFCLVCSTAIGTSRR